MGSIISTFKVVSSFRFKMMFYLLLVVPLVSGGTLPGSPDLLLGPGGHYEHPIDPDYYSQNEVYKIKDKDDCHPVERTIYKHKEKDGKGAVKCEKVPKKKCYDTPRKVREETCKPVHSRFCEKFTNEFPVPQQKQNCHTEPMKRCELEVRSRP